MAATAPPRRPFFVMNPRSGGGKVGRFGLVEKARQLGATVHVLDDAVTDIALLARQAIDQGADLLGVAGGDGTLAVVAGVAAEHDVPLVVIPAGTRNHLAMDLGLDRSRPDRALDALVEGEELTIDLGTIGDRRFVNTASFGAYAEIVERPDYRNDKLRVSLDVLPEVLRGYEHTHFTVTAATFTATDPTAALISNNPYDTGDIAGLGRRSRLDGGMLGLLCVHVRPPVPPHRLARELNEHPPVRATTAAEVVVDGPTRWIAAAIDGESIQLETPVHCRIQPGSLRVRVPRLRP